MAFQLTGQVVLLPPNNLTQIRNQIQSSLRSFNGVNSAVTDASSQLQDFGRQAGLAARRFTAFTAAAGTMVRFARAVREGVREAISFERELVKISQLGNNTVSQISSISREIGALSSNLGVSSSELVKTARVLSQAGFAAEDVRKSLGALAQAALAPNFSNLADTVQGAIAAMRQFDIQSSDLENTLGSINAVASQFAVDAGDITQAIQRTGGAFRSAGGELNQLIALFASVRDTTRESSSSIATGLRTIFTRLQRESTVEALENLGINLRRTRQEALALGNVNLQGQFVGAYEAIRRISVGLRDIPSASPQFARVIEQIGGFRQVSRVIPLIREFGTTQRAFQTAQFGGGSLQSSTAKSAESLEVRIARLNEQFLTLARDVVSSPGFQNLAKAFIDIGEAVGFAVNALKPLIPLLAGLAIGQGAKFLFGGGFRNLSTSFFGAPTLRSGPRPQPFVFQHGGLVPNARPGVDTIPAMVTGGEFIFDRESTQNIGVSNLKSLQQRGKTQRYNNGGSILEAIALSRKEVKEYNARGRKLVREFISGQRDPDSIYGTDTVDRIPLQDRVQLLNTPLLKSQVSQGRRNNAVADRLFEQLGLPLPSRFSGGLFTAGRNIANKKPFAGLFTSGPRPYPRATLIAKQGDGFLYGQGRGEYLKDVLSTVAHEVGHSFDANNQAFFRSSSNAVVDRPFKDLADFTRSNIISPFVNRAAASNTLPEGYSREEYLNYLQNPQESFTRGLTYHLKSRFPEVFGDNRNSTGTGVTAAGLFLGLGDRFPNRPASDSFRDTLETLNRLSATVINTISRESRSRGAQSFRGINTSTLQRYLPLDKYSDLTDALEVGHATARGFASGGILDDDFFDLDGSYQISSSSEIFDTSDLKLATASARNDYFNRVGAGSKSREFLRRIIDDQSNLGKRPYVPSIESAAAILGEGPLKYGLRKPLTLEEAIALRKNTRRYDVATNAGLRQRGGLPGFLSRHTELLDSALNKSGALGAGLLFRGVSDINLIRRREPGFLSTSLDPNTAIDFGGSDANAGLVTILRGAQDKGINLTGISQFPYEEEVLLPRNSKFRTLARERVEGPYIPPRTLLTLIEEGTDLSRKQRRGLYQQSISKLRDAGINRFRSFASGGEITPTALEAIKLLSSSSTQIGASPLIKEAPNFLNEILPAIENSSFRQDILGLINHRKLLGYGREGGVYDAGPGKVLRVGDRRPFETFLKSILRSDTSGAIDSQIITPQLAKGLLGGSLFRPNIPEVLQAFPGTTKNFGPFVTELLPRVTPLSDQNLSQKRMRSIAQDLRKRVIGRGYFPFDVAPRNIGTTADGQNLLIDPTAALEFAGGFRGFASGGEILNQLMQNGRLSPSETYPSEETLQSFLTGSSNNLTGPLSKAEILAARLYTDGARYAFPINRQLRRRGRLTGKQSTLISLLDSAIGKSRVGDTPLFRGVETDDFLEATDRGFISTTSNPNTGLRYSGDSLLNLILNPNQPGLSLGDLSNYPITPETILGRRHKFKLFSQGTVGNVKRDVSLYNLVSQDAGLSRKEIQRIIGRNIDIANAGGLGIQGLDAGGFLSQQSAQLQYQRLIDTLGLGGNTRFADFLRNTQLDIVDGQEILSRQRRSGGLPAGGTFNANDNVISLNRDAIRTLGGANEVIFHEGLHAVDASIGQLLFGNSLFGSDRVGEFPNRIGQAGISSALSKFPDLANASDLVKTREGFVEYLNPLLTGKKELNDKRIGTVNALLAPIGGRLRPELIPQDISFIESIYRRQSNLISRGLPLGNLLRKDRARVGYAGGGRVKSIPDFTSIADSYRHLQEVDKKFPIPYPKIFEENSLLRQAILLFQGTGNFGINAVLNDVNGPRAKRAIAGHPNIIELANALSAHVHQQRTSFNVSALRGVSSERELQDIQNQIGTDLLSQNAIGKTFTRKSFSSFSFDEQLAGQFGRAGQIIGLFPKGSILGGIDNFGEQETLSAPGQKFKIIGNAVDSKNLPILRALAIGKPKLAKLQTGGVVNAQNIRRFLGEFGDITGINPKSISSGIKVGRNFFNPQQQKSLGKFASENRSVYLNPSAINNEKDLRHVIFHEFSHALDLSQQGQFNSTLAGTPNNALASTVLRSGLGDIIRQAYARKPENFLQEGFAFGSDALLRGKSQVILPQFEEVLATLGGRFNPAAVAASNRRLGLNNGGEVFPTDAFVQGSGGIDTNYGYLPTGAFVLNKRAASNLKSRRRGFAGGGYNNRLQPVALTRDEYVASPEMVNQIGLANFRLANQTGDTSFLKYNKGGYIGLAAGNIVPPPPIGSPIGGGNNPNQIIFLLTQIVSQLSGIRSALTATGAPVGPGGGGGGANANIGTPPTPPPITIGAGGNFEATRGSVQPITVAGRLDRAAALAVRTFARQQGIDTNSRDASGALTSASQQNRAALSQLAQQIGAEVRTAVNGSNRSQVQFGVGRRADGTVGLLPTGQRVARQTFVNGRVVPTLSNEAAIRIGAAGGPGYGNATLRSAVEVARLNQLRLLANQQGVATTNGAGDVREVRQLENALVARSGGRQGLEALLARRQGLTNANISDVIRRQVSANRPELSAADQAAVAAITEQRFRAGEIAGITDSQGNFTGTTAFEQGVSPDRNFQNTLREARRRRPGQTRLQRLGTRVNRNFRNLRVAAPGILRDPTSLTLSLGTLAGIAQPAIAGNLDAQTAITSGQSQSFVNRQGAGGFLSGAATGASVGVAFGPVAAGVGAVVGGFIGLASAANSAAAAIKSAEIGRALSDVGATINAQNARLRRNQLGGENEVERRRVSESIDSQFNRARDLAFNNTRTFGIFNFSSERQINAEQERVFREQFASQAPALQENLLLRARNQLRENPNRSVDDVLNGFTRDNSTNIVLNALARQANISRERFIETQLRPEIINQQFQAQLQDNNNNLLNLASQMTVLANGVSALTQAMSQNTAQVLAANQASLGRIGNVNREQLTDNLLGTTEFSSRVNRGLFGAAPGGAAANSRDVLLAGNALAQAAPLLSRLSEQGSINREAVGSALTQFVSERLGREIAENSPVAQLINNITSQVTQGGTDTNVNRAIQQGNFNLALTEALGANPGFAAQRTQFNNLQTATQEMIANFDRVAQALIETENQIAQLDFQRADLRAQQLRTQASFASPILATQFQQFTVEQALAPLRAQRANLLSRTNLAPDANVAQIAAEFQNVRNEISSLSQERGSADPARAAALENRFVSLTRQADALRQALESYTRVQETTRVLEERLNVLRSEESSRFRVGEGLLGADPRTLSRLRRGLSVAVDADTNNQNIASLSTFNRRAASEALRFFSGTNLRVNGRDVNVDELRRRTLNRAGFGLNENQRNQRDNLQDQITQAFTDGQQALVGGLISAQTDNATRLRDTLSQQNDRFLSRLGRVLGVESGEDLQTRRGALSQERIAATQRSQAFSGLLGQRANIDAVFGGNIRALADTTITSRLEEYLSGRRRLETFNNSFTSNENLFNNTRAQAFTTSVNDLATTSSTLRNFRRLINNQAGPGLFDGPFGEFSTVTSQGVQLNALDDLAGLVARSDSGAIDSAGLTRLNEFAAENPANLQGLIAANPANAADLQRFNERTPLGTFSSATAAQSAPIARRILLRAISDLRARDLASQFDDVGGVNVGALSNLSVNSISNLLAQSGNARTADALSISTFAQLTAQMGTLDGTLSSLTEQIQQLTDEIADSTFSDTQNSAISSAGLSPRQTSALSAAATLTPAQRTSVVNGLGLNPEQLQRLRDAGIILASGGSVPNLGNTGIRVGTDTVPALLTPGEFVVNAQAARANLPLLQQMNMQRFQQGGLVGDQLRPHVQFASTLADSLSIARYNARYATSTNPGFRPVERRSDAYIFALLSNLPNNVLQDEMSRRSSYIWPYFNESADLRSIRDGFLSGLGFNPGEPHALFNDAGQYPRSFDELYSIARAAQFVGPQPRQAVENRQTIEDFMSTYFRNATANDGRNAQALALEALLANPNNALLPAYVNRDAVARDFNNISLSNFFNSQGARWRRQLGLPNADILARRLGFNDGGEPNANYRLPTRANSIAEVLNLARTPRSTQLLNRAAVTTDLATRTALQTQASVNRALELRDVIRERQLNRGILFELLGAQDNPNNIRNFFPNLNQRQLQSLIATTRNQYGVSGFNGAQLSLLRNAVNAGDRQNISLGVNNPFLSEPSIPVLAQAIRANPDVQDVSTLLALARPALRQDRTADDQSLLQALQETREDRIEAILLANPNVGSPIRNNPALFGADALQNQLAAANLIREAATNDPEYLRRMDPATRRRAIFSMRQRYGLTGLQTERIQLATEAARQFHNFNALPFFGQLLRSDAEINRVSQLTDAYRNEIERSQNYANQVNAVNIASDQVRSYNLAGRYSRARNTVFGESAFAEISAAGTSAFESRINAADRARQLGFNNPTGFATGGPVPGSGNTDTVPALLTPGEFVLNTAAVRSIGLQNLLNWNRYQTGGPVENSSSAPRFSNQGFSQQSTSASTVQEMQLNTESFDTSISAFNSSVNVFQSSAARLAEALSSIPDTIEMNANVRVEHIHNGLEVLTTLEKGMAEFLKGEIAAQFNEFIKTRFPDVEPV